MRGFHKAWNAVGVAAHTLRNFYQVMEDTYVGIRIQPFVSEPERIIHGPAISDL